MSALPNRRRAAASDSIGYRMKELLQQLELDDCRSALLLSARAELERSRQERPAGTGVERRRKPPPSARQPRQMGGLAGSAMCKSP
jgi:hypothetical protein